MRTGFEERVGLGRRTGQSRRETRLGLESGLAFSLTPALSRWERASRVIHRPPIPLKAVSRAPSPSGRGQG